LAWIESHQELRGHPKLELCAELLGIPEVHLAGHLHYLWYWAMDYAQEGDITKYKAVQIAKAAGWTGDAERFVSALVGCGADGQPGFLERTDDGQLLIHDWFEYGGRLIEMRRHNADKQKAWRDRNKPPRDRHVTGTSRTRNAPEDNVTVTLPSRNGTTEEDTTQQDTTGHNRTEETEAPGEDSAQAEKPRPLPPPPAVNFTQSMKDRMALQGMIESAACDLKGRRLTRAELGAINQWFTRHKARASPEVVEAAATETAKHTDGGGLAYLFAVMERMIYHPEQNQPVRKEGKQSGQQSNGHGSGQNGVGTPGKSKRALAVEQRWRERTGTELDEVSFDGVADPPSDHRGRPGPRRELPPGSS
jgi:hypothetical protein